MKTGRPAPPSSGGRRMLRWTLAAAGAPALLLVLGGLGLLGGCDSTPWPATRAYLGVAVVDFADGSPQAGVKLLLMDPLANLPVQGPFLTGPDGLARFGPIRPGRYAVLVYPGPQRGVRSWPRTIELAGRPGRDGPFALTAPPPERAPLPPPLLLLQTYQRPPQALLPRVRGRVTDAVTGRPLDQVFVGPAAHVGAYLFQNLQRDDVTAADGLFDVVGRFFALDPETGNLVMIEPLIFARHGYAVHSWTYHPPNGSDETDITGVEIALQSAEPGSGVLTGVVAWGDTGQAGVLVGLAAGPMPVGALKGGPPPPGGEARPLSGVGVPGRVAVTDASGRFRFEGLAPGLYAVSPGYLPDDPYVFFRQTGSAFVPVADGRVTDLDTLWVLRAIMPLEPAPSSSPPPPVRRLRWTAAAGADSYFVTLDRGVVGTFADTLVELPEPIAAGDHVWFVAALRRDGAYVGQFEQQPFFRLPPP